MKDEPTNNYGHDPTHNIKPQKPQMLVDYAHYAKMLDHPDLSDQQKKEFIDCLWNLITEMIYLGFEVLPYEEDQDISHEDRFENMLERMRPNMVNLRTDQSNKTPNKSPAS